MQVIARIMSLLNTTPAPGTATADGATGFTLDTDDAVLPAAAADVAASGVLPRGVTVPEGSGLAVQRDRAPVAGWLGEGADTDDLDAMAPAASSATAWLPGMAASSVDTSDTPGGVTVGDAAAPVPADARTAAEPSVTPLVPVPPVDAGTVAGRHGMADTVTGESDRIAPAVPLATAAAGTGAGALPREAAGAVPVAAAQPPQAIPSAPQPRAVAAEPERPSPDPKTIATGPRQAPVPEAADNGASVSTAWPRARSEPPHAAALAPRRDIPAGATAPVRPPEAVAAEAGPTPPSGPVVADDGPPARAPAPSGAAFAPLATAAKPPGRADSLPLSGVTRMPTEAVAAPVAGTEPVAQGVPQRAPRADADMARSLPPSGLSPTPQAAPRVVAEPAAATPAVSDAAIPRPPLAARQTGASAGPSAAADVPQVASGGAAPAMPPRAAPSAVAAPAATPASLAQAEPIPPQGVAVPPSQGTLAAEAGAMPQPARPPARPLAAMPPVPPEQPAARRATPAAGPVAAAAPPAGAVPAARAATSAPAMQRPATVLRAPAVAEPAILSDVGTLAEPPAATRADGPVTAAQTAAMPRADTAVAAANARMIAEAMALATGQDHIELRLDPPELGRIAIDMSVDGTTVSATLTAERPETLELLRRHVDALQRELSASGFGHADIDFGGQGQGGRGERAGAAVAGQDPGRAQLADAPAIRRPPAADASGRLDIRL